MTIKFIIKLPDGKKGERPELAAADRLESMAILFRERNFKEEMNKHGLKLDLFDRTDVTRDDRPARIGILTVEHG